MKHLEKKARKIDEAMRELLNHPELQKEQHYTRCGLYGAIDCMKVFIDNLGNTAQ